MTVKLDAFGITDLGKCRESNEDQFFIGEMNGSMKVYHTSVPIEDCSTVFGDSQGYFLLVADGLGGHAAGERASALAIAGAAAYAVNRLTLLKCAANKDDVFKELQSLAAECQDRLAESARTNPREEGMATTLTLAIVCWPRLFLMHIGDSRCYLLRDGKMKPLTRDHTLGQLFSELGDNLDSEHGAKHALWNVVSSQNEAHPVADVMQAELQLADQLILCTDGLYNHVDDQTIRDVVTRETDCRDACDQLVATANERGGKDNITVILSRFRPERDAERGPMVETRVPLEQVVDDPGAVRPPHDTDEFVLADILEEDRRRAEPILDEPPA